MAQDFDKICRTCMEELEQAISLTDILSIEAQEVKLGDILSTLTCFEITENDKLPQQICAECKILLVNAFSFQQQCYKSNHILRTVLESHQSDEYDLIEHFDDEDNIEKASTEGTLSAEENLDDFCQTGETEQQDEDLQMSITDICTTSKDDKNLDTISSNHTCMEENCQKWFTSSEELKQHQEKIHKIYTCQICNKAFDNLHSFIKHNSSCYNCLACKKVFNSYVHLKTHIMKCHPKRHECNLCDKSFTRLENLSRHKESHNVIKTWCKKCRKMLNGPLSLKDHMKMNHLDTFDCDVCQKFFSASDLIEHQKTHPEKRPYNCAICGACFINNSKLKDHVERHRYSSRTSFLCTVCHKEFARYYQFNQHLRTHTGKKRFVCTICNEVFITNYRLNEHQRTHGDDSPYLCKFCEKRCHNKIELVRHVKTHKLLQ